MQTVTLHSEDFRTVHNTLCALRSLVQSMDGVVSDALAERAQKIVSEFERGLADAYQQDNEIFDRKMDHYSEFRRSQGLENSIWSMYEVDNLHEPHPYGKDAKIVYTEHWGKGDKTDAYPIEGDTWGDVYRAANRAIAESGDEHHVFIEGFVKKGEALHLVTGS